MLTTVVLQLVQGLPLGPCQLIAVALCVLLLAKTSKVLAVILTTNILLLNLLGLARSVAGIFNPSPL